uniref:Uncharacterized protein n=1 Tax=Anguilla anguilla TaxID=7936 RepID=A0A0E9X6S0_ANGAN
MNSSAHLCIIQEYLPKPKLTFHTAKKQKNKNTLFNILKFSRQPEYPKLDLSQASYIIRLGMFCLCKTTCPVSYL